MKASSEKLKSMFLTNSSPGNEQQGAEYLILKIKNQQKIFGTTRL